MEAMTPRARYTSKVSVGGRDDCWPWIPPKRYDGYAALKVKGRALKAHRLAWEFSVGPIPAGMCVLHKCDNRQCQNPRHLFLGTKGDNNRDRDRKGRRVNPVGEAHGRAKLTASQVLEIRKLRGKFTNAELGRRFGVHHVTISKIQLRKQWRHV